MAVKATAAEAAAAWSTGFGAAGAKYQAGINAVQVAPGQLAANQKSAYVAGVNNSQNIWAANVAKVTLQEWKQAASTTGVQRLSTGATKGAPKFQAFATAFLPQLSSIVGSLPARGDFSANMNRSMQYATQLHALKGSF
jgi:hypothetical protein